MIERYFGFIDFPSEEESILHFYDRPLSFLIHRGGEVFLCHLVEEDENTESYLLTSLDPLEVALLKTEFSQNIWKVLSVKESIYLQHQTYQPRSVRLEVMPFRDIEPFIR